MITDSIDNSLWRCPRERVFLCHGQSGERARLGFTLVELLVVVAIIAILFGITLPALVSARAKARTANCISNIRQLHLANTAYSNQWDGHYVVAAPDVFSTNKVRWHGIRTSNNESFDFQFSPLYSYLDKEKEIKVCPSFRKYISGENAAFESGTGGYGYNQQYVGGTNYLYGVGPEAACISTRSDAILNPTDCVMFADAAMPVGYPEDGLIEYSFIEPPRWHLQAGRETSTYQPDPSIHFRHGGRAVAVWCDGHTSTESLAFTKDDNIYNGDNKKWQVGWFGPDDNSKFDVW